MRKSTKALLVPAIGAAALIYSGFPSRVGLTRSQAQVSMPGDLIYPTAALQGDRQIAIQDAGDEDGLKPIWPYLTELQAHYEDLLDTPLETVFHQDADLVVWKTARPARDDSRDLDLFEASIAAVLRPAGGATTLHVRERYAILDSVRGRLAATVVLTASAGVITAQLRRIRRWVQADWQAKELFAGFKN